MKPLRVALDVRHRNRSGIGVYIRGILSGFAEIDAPVLWTLIGDGAESTKGIAVERTIPFTARPYSFRETLTYPRLNDVDLLHLPHYNRPPRVRVPSVVTVHDLIHLHGRDPLRRNYQAWFLRSLLREDTTVVTVSEKAADDLRALLNWRDKPVRVIPSGPGNPDLPDALPQPAPIRLPSGEEIRPPWLLAAGIDKPHKNMDRVLAAITLASERGVRLHPLIWTGLSPADARRRTRSLPPSLRAQVRYLPYGTDGAYLNLLAGAAVLIFPSLEEGFGFPPLEAMRFGIPVLCADRRPMTDMLGDAPIRFDPADTASLISALAGLNSLTAEARAHISERSRAVAARFTWKSAAAAMLGVYREAAGRA